MLQNGVVRVCACVEGVLVSGVQGGLHLRREGGTSFVDNQELC